jgi:hypothetical protein
MQHPKAIARCVFTQLMSASATLALAACLVSMHSRATADESIDRTEHNQYGNRPDNANHHPNRDKHPRPPSPPQDCEAATAETPMFVTDDCVDPRFNLPYVDLDEWRDTPVRHRYVHGGFTGTDAKFSFAFPPYEQYRGRFIQGPTHQLTSNENLLGEQIAFAISSGGYAVQTNMGGSEAATFTEAVLFFGFDPAVAGYRVNAAAAKYSRVEAAEMYGRHRPYGYLYGGSGGAYQTISSAENTTVWDGYVPFVLGSPASIPNGYTLRINAQRILGSSGKFPCILDAVDPGGSGDPVTSCNLNEEQAGAYDEATRLGFPPRAWFGASLAGAGALPLVAGYVPFLDSRYTEDFWSLPGYLGHDDPYGSLAPLRIIHNTTVTEKLTSPNRLRLASFPPGDRTAIDLRILSGAGVAARQIGLPPGYVRAPTISAAPGEFTVTIPAFGVAIYDAVQVGDQVALDNSHFLALQTYHRHQVGTDDWNFYPWQQLFLDAGGNPIYPQRDVLTGPVGQFNGSGGNMTGVFHGKMILQESLMDPDAHPWGADWYKKKVEQVLCAKEGRKNDRDRCKAPGQARKVAERLNSVFRVYMQDHAQHSGGGGTATRTVSYNGALQQDLRDLAAWVEYGIAPPPSTNYTLDGGQVLVPPTARERKGIQAVVTLKANGSQRAEVSVGETVTLSGLIEVPPGTGKVVSVEWNVEGVTAVGAFQAAAFGAIKPSVSVETTHVFTQPGTYFPVLRASSQRQGDPGTAFALVDNIGRVRVVVQ